MPTAQELIVAIRSEGVDQTRGKLEDVGDSMSDTASKAGNSADRLEGFSQKFQGAMGAAVAALAVGAAGLLSQVPVIGEVASGLGAVVDSVVVKIDETLRPILTPITNKLFELAKAISNTDGTLGKIIGVITTVIAVGLVLAGVVVAIGAAIAPFLAGLSAIATVGGLVISAITTIAGALLSLPVILGLLVAAVIAFVAAYIFNIGGVRDKTNSILGKVFDFFVRLGQDILAWAKSTASMIFEKAKKIGAQLLQGIKNKGKALLTYIGTLKQGFFGLCK
jgi:hypothetical protein